MAENDDTKPDMMKSETRRGEPGNLTGSGGREDFTRSKPVEERSPQPGSDNDE
jgi:hypothetical protein